MVARQSLRIVFFGTPEFALSTLDALLASRHSVVGVVTQPDRPRGRGQKTTAGPVKARAIDAGLPVFQPTRLKDPAWLAALSDLHADIGIVAAYGRILPESVLTIPPLGMVNVHGSLLPSYRGAAPVHRAIIAGDHETGVTIMRVVKALDAGPMLAKAARPIGPDETSVEVERGLAALGASLLVETLEVIASGEGCEIPQDEALVTYAPPLKKEEGDLDWSLDAQALHNRVRGLHPWPHAFTRVHGQHFVIRRSAIRPASPGVAAPGTVVVARGDELHIATRSGSLALLEVQLEGKRPMSARDFLSGHRLSVGEHLPN